MNNYYQWSGKTREFRYEELKRALASGEIPPAGPCEICGQKRGTMYHNEAYGPTYADHMASRHSVCARCHAMIHLRFMYPGRWAEYKERCRRHGEQPVVKNMSSMYYGRKARGWAGDCPVIRYKEGRTWWETLTCVRYQGPLAPEP